MEKENIQEAREEEIIEEENIEEEAIDLRPNTNTCDEIFCKASFSSKSKLDNHKSNMHKPDRICGPCGKSFDNSLFR